MGTIAKGEITLSPVNDAYTVSVTPSVCAINAAFDGTAPQLENANGTIQLLRGARAINFHISSYTLSTEEGVTIEHTSGSATSHTFGILSISTTVSSGTITFQLLADDGSGFTTTASFSFNVVRSANMLDWVLDWDGSKTKIGNTYIMTPKLFVGHKDDVVEYVNGEAAWREGAISGVYLGPDLLDEDNSSVGIYGYYEDSEVFHLNADGGFVGGWTFDPNGLYSSNNLVHINSVGDIYATNLGNDSVHWGIYADGGATFSNGNVQFSANGDVLLKGQIIARSGYIANWEITSNQLYNNGILLSSAGSYIAVVTDELGQDKITKDYVFPDNPTGAVRMWYSTSNNFGLVGYAGGQKVFELGSTNKIGGWQFNHKAIWTGSEAPYLTQGVYASASGELTVAPNGIRSQYWYVDSDGTASFAAGGVKFYSDYAEMFGWTLKSNRMGVDNVVLRAGTSSADHPGLYICNSSLTSVANANLYSAISSNGGIFVGLASNGSACALFRLRRQSESKDTVYLTSVGTCQISGWLFDSTNFYTGTLTTSGFTSSANNITMGAGGIRGYKWRLEGDGTGSLAGGAISWSLDDEGVASLSVEGTITATGGTIGGFTIGSSMLYYGLALTVPTTGLALNNALIIKPESYISSSGWVLKTNGSGILAKGSIQWSTSGNLNLAGGILAKNMTYRITAPADNDILSNSFVVSSGGSYVLPALSEGSGRVIELLLFQPSGEMLTTLELCVPNEEVSIITQGKGSTGVSSMLLSQNSGTMAKPGLWRLLGFHRTGDDVTYWNVTRIDEAMESFTFNVGSGSKGWSSTKVDDIIQLDANGNPLL